MKLYHGTFMPFRVVDLTKAFPNRDFGPGFYLTDDADEAMEMGGYRVNYRGGHPTVLTFVLDEDAMRTSGLRIKQFNGCTLAWAQFVSACRKGATHDYDVVIGPIADGPLTYLINKFESGRITVESLRKRLSAKKVYTQYLFATQRAVDLLRFVG